MPAGNGRASLFPEAKNPQLAQLKGWSIDFLASLMAKKRQNN
jgi:hypothetical protein